MKRRGKRKTYSFYLGRWQCIPPHRGHRVLIERCLMEGKNVVIGIRKRKTRNRDNPFTATEIKKSLAETFRNWGKRVIIIVMPDIDEICYGRDVGYRIREIKLPEEIEKISATKLREKNYYGNNPNNRTN